MKLGSYKRLTQLEGCQVYLNSRDSRISFFLSLVVSCLTNMKETVLMRVVTANSSSYIIKFLFAIVLSYIIYIYIGRGREVPLLLNF